MNKTTQPAVAGPVEPEVSPYLVKGEDIRKGVDYFLTNDFWPYANLKVRLKRRFVAKDAWPGARGNGALVQSDDGKLFVIHPKNVVFAAPMAAPSGPN